jgi:mono/diheme cytochrome c family protein
MNFLERIPTRWLLAGAALACLALWAAPSSAQTTGDATLGKTLFDDTPNAAPDANLTHNCINCHGSVQDRRKKISADSSAAGGFADISFDTAIGRFGNAIASQAAMSEFKGLDVDQVRNIAAYLADTPKVTATGLSASNALAFDASASGVSVTKNVTINHSIATTDNLKIVSVTLDAGATAFTRSGACNNVTRSPAGTCTFSISYTPTTVSNETKNLTITLQQGSVTFTRPLTLNGSVAGATTPPPPPPPSSGEESGGGALGWMWLTGLGLATAVLSRRRRV